MKKNDVLIVIDMQNDFIDGALGSKEAQAIVPKVAEFIKNFPGNTIITTQDTHAKRDYLDTMEGKKLPIPHCLFGTWGHDINDEVDEALKYKEKNGVEYSNICKFTFGCIDLPDFLDTDDLEDDRTFYICGLCTDICVISNAMIIKAHYPNNEIVVLKDLCAGTTPGNHAMALVSMNHCHIDTIRSNEV